MLQHDDGLETGVSWATGFVLPGKSLTITVSAKVLQKAFSERRIVRAVKGLSSHRAL
jgi:hypothetical protein